MIRFLFKGLLRDKSRSRLPMLVVAIGVMLSVFLHAYVTGLMVDMVEQTARFSSGHVKVMTPAYADNLDQVPNDLALIDVGALTTKLQATFPNISWAARIKFGGLMDVPGPDGETKSQGPAMGMGVDLLSPASAEIDRLNLHSSLVRGNLPIVPGDMLISEDFAQKLGVLPGEKITLIGSTMNGGMAVHNFRISGTLRFGTAAMDRGTVIADIADIQIALDMQDAAGEILGFFPEGYYDDAFAKPVAGKFMEVFPDIGDEYQPTLYTMRDEENLSMFIDMSNYMGVLITGIFILAMSLVLWNAGLIGGLRRYGEIGLRLAIGEEKGHIYRTLLVESVMIGIAGTVVGTAAGLCFAWILQEYGLNMGEFTRNASASVMMPNVIRARITATDFYIGFIPGVLSTLVGTALSGIGIYKRKTAQLFKELEV